MKKKTFVTFALAAVLMLTPCYSAKAGILDAIIDVAGNVIMGIADVVTGGAASEILGSLGLLSDDDMMIAQLKELNSQQTAQRNQDFAIHGYAEVTRNTTSLDYYKKYTNDALNLLKNAQGMSQYYAAAKSFVNTSDYIFKTLQQLESDKQYLFEVGSEHIADLAQMNYLRFSTLTMNLVESTRTSLKTYENLNDLRPAEVLNILNEVSQSLAGYVHALADDSLNRMDELASEAALERNVNANVKFLEMML